MEEHARRGGLPLPVWSLALRVPRCCAGRGLTRSRGGCLWKVSCALLWMRTGREARWIQIGGLGRWSWVGLGESLDVCVASHTHTRTVTANSR
jgi:hypothetical protein